MFVANGHGIGLALSVIISSVLASPGTLTVTAAEATVVTTTTVAVTCYIDVNGKLHVMHVLATGVVHGSGAVTIHMAIGVVSNLVCVIGTVSPG